MLKQQLQQKLQQRLSPQQIQVIRLLELTTIEIEERVEQELIDNPALEEGIEQSSLDSEYDEGSLPEQGESAEDMTLADYRTEDDIPDYKLEADNFSKQERREEIPFSGSSTFHDMLFRQLGLRPLAETEQQIGEYIIGNIDDAGYLQRPIASIAEDLIFQAGIDVSQEQIEEILHLIQDFEPAGVGASNLRECLMLQLERKEGTKANMNAYDILNESFDEFSKKHYDKIVRQHNLTDEELRNAIHEITSLTPKPGNNYSDSYTEGMQHIIPEFIVESQDGEITLSLNSGNVPDLRINKTYANMLADYTANKSNQSRERLDALLFVKQKLDAAQWFLDALKQRQQTLMDTMQVIISLQRDFFLTGDESLLKPMILKDVADKAGYDISTISRVSNQKYVQTNFGVYLLKYFFSESMQNESGEEVSSREIKQLLKELIEREDKLKPLADDKLCELLKQKKYIIARRTVAKYREQLGIPVARLRKKI